MESAESIPYHHDLFLAEALFAGFDYHWTSLSVLRRFLAIGNCKPGGLEFSGDNITTRFHHHSHH